MAEIDYEQLKHDLFKHYVREFNEGDGEECETDFKTETCYDFSATTNTQYGYQYVLCANEEAVKKVKEMLRKQEQEIKGTADFFKKNKELTIQIERDEAKNTVTVHYSYWYI